MTLKIAHVTSAHPRNDSRIYLKQCRSLASHGIDVTLIVADGLGDEDREGVSIRDVGASPGRLSRILLAPRRVYRKLMALEADVYHLHDPELLPIGLRLGQRGKTVIFDAHEDVPKQLLAKPYLGPRRLRMLARTYARFERFAAGRLDGIVAATPAIGRRFRSLNERTVVVNNYPLPDELYAGQSWEKKTDAVCYVGGLSEQRGICELVDAIGQLRSPARLFLAGRFSEPGLEAELRSRPGWKKTDHLGYLDRPGLKRVLAESVAGLVTLHPTPNHVDSQPIKMFEYMSAGIPVIASRFPLWRTIIEGAECGYCVDAMDTAAIAGKIDALITNRDEARRLGENGRAAVLDRYNWPLEQRKLCEFYSTLTSGSVG